MQRFFIRFLLPPLNPTPTSLRGGLKLWQHNVTIHIAGSRESLKILLESLKILLVFFLNTQQFLCNFKTNRRTDEQTNKLPCYATFHTHSVSSSPCLASLGHRLDPHYPFIRPSARWPVGSATLSQTTATAAAAAEATTANLQPFSLEDFEG